jgi:hypothetical protein
VQRVGSMTAVAFLRLVVFFSEDVIGYTLNKL